MSLTLIMFNEIKITLRDLPSGVYCAGESVSGEIWKAETFCFAVASKSFALIVGFVELDIRESNTKAKGNTSC